MDKEALKRAAAQQALDYIETGSVLGVGTGSTIKHFIQALSTVKAKIDGAVSSSIQSAEQLKALGIRVMDLNEVSEIPLYVDGADEVNQYRQMIKGGGGAHTREKIVAMVAKRFVCIVDESKCVDRLGEFPVAVEVLPLARSYVARQIVKLGANPVYRPGFITDNGNVILDVYNLDLIDPAAMEERLKQLTGVVESGIFAKRRADIVLVAKVGGVAVQK